MTRKMKDSGIEWIGEIPEDWEVVRNKNIFNRKKEIIENEWKNTQLLSLTTKGIIKKDISILEGKLPESFSTYQFVNKGDLVLCLFDLDMSAVFNGYCQYDGMISPAYKRYVLKAEGDLRYYNYLFDFIFDKRKYKIYSTTLRFTLDNQEFDRIPTIKPNLKQQIEIANFLDRKTKQIEDIKNTINNEIETIENYKKSVITEAVTKGLDKNVEMKDSGIEWIGEIPEHWSISRIKYLTTSRSEKGNLSDTNKYIGLENVESKTGKYIKTDTDYIDAVYDQCKKGDLLYGKLRPNLNKVLISPFDASCTGEFEIIKESTIDKKWLYYYFLTPGFTNIVNSSTFGAKMPRASWTFIENIKIAYPNDSEMQEIVSYIDSISNVTDVAICSKQKQLEVLEEYKKSLIYEYVTGKKEVKDGEET